MSFSVLSTYKLENNENSYTNYEHCESIHLANAQTKVHYLVEISTL